MRMRLLPHPMLTAILAAVWVLLVNDFSWSAADFGLLLGLAIAKLTSPTARPAADSQTVVSWSILPSFLGHYRLKREVAYLVLFRRGDSLRSQFVTIPLALESPEAIATLAGTITMTPGTLSADLSADGRSLLVHCLETTDAAGTVAAIKSRYEHRLMRIFE